MHGHPDIFYKYCSLSSDEHRARLKNLLHKGEIYFSSPLHFNDPFDCAAPIQPIGNIGAIKQNFRRIAKNHKMKWTEIRKIEGRLGVRDPNKLSLSIIDLIQREMRTTGIYCISTKNDHPLMWSHYSDSHRGVCIGFDANKAPFIAAQKVSYSSVRPQLQMMEHEGSFEKAFLHKADWWEYESEYRIINHRSTREERVERSMDPIWDTEMVRFILEMNGPGIFRVAKTTIRSICFGCKCDSQLVSEITAMAKATIPNIEIWRAEMHQDNYALQMKRIRD